MGAQPHLSRPPSAAPTAAADREVTTQNDNSDRLRNEKSRSHLPPINGCEPRGSTASGERLFGTAGGAAPAIRPYCAERRESRIDLEKRFLRAHQV